MSHIDPRSAYPEFYDNAIIQAIADVSRWTVSDNQKVPIDMRELMSTGRLWGARQLTAECLVRLDELNAYLPDAANNAFYLRAQTDGFMVLDIEKTCPPEVAEDLLRIPGYLVERSMSGKGFHVILPLPANFWDFPIATGKKVLKEEHGWYEILLDHWVTFTRNVVPQASLPTPDYVSGPWERLYASLASQAVETPVAVFNITSDRPDIPRVDQILNLMTRRPLEKSLDDFGGDFSRFEFSTLASLFNRLKPILVAIRDADPEAVFDEPEKAWIIYEAATALLPYREKHDEVRNGMPLLLNAAVALVGRRAGDEAAAAERA